MADAVRPVSMGYFRSGLGIESKADDSPVTLADRAAETVMRRMLEVAVPEHGIIGEEHGTKDADADFVWVLDPIDGTQTFATGKPLFGTLIALLHQGEPLIGIIDMPALDERWVGVRGRTTLFKGQPAATRPCKNLKDAWLYATSPQMFVPARFQNFENLRTACRRTVYGAECQAYGLLSSGWVDVVCEDTLQPYDYAALIPVIEGAGGVITDWQGNALTTASAGHVIAVGDPDLHEKAMAALS
ncbi:MAG: histidinol phosphate phosphatase [Rhodospirillales bacterium]|nr:histidinol phosphate phosphatase [Rhodospirillales bacterium]